MSRPLRLFISYAQEDIIFATQLKNHLIPLINKGAVELFYDQEIRPGERWNEVIKLQLEKSDIMLLLLSADFMASKYIYDVELESAKLRHKAREIVIISVIVRSCDYESTWLGDLELLPTGAQPVESEHWKFRDAAWKNVIEGIKKVLIAPKPEMSISSKIPELAILSSSEPGHRFKFQKVLISAFGLALLFSFIYIWVVKSGDESLKKTKVRRIEKETSIDFKELYIGSIPNGDTGRITITGMIIQKAGNCDSLRLKRPMPTEKDPGTVDQYVVYTILKDINSKAVIDEGAYTGPFKLITGNSVRIFIQIRDVYYHRPFNDATNWSGNITPLSDFEICDPIKVVVETASKFR